MYKIIYTDGTFFEGGDYKESKWGKQPIKPIKKIEYTLFDRTLVLEDFEAYAHLVERRKIQGVKEGLITAVILIGKESKESVCYIWDFIKQTFYVEIRTYGKEYNDRPITSWKEGIEDLPPKATLR